MNLSLHRWAASPCPNLGACAPEALPDMLRVEHVCATLLLAKLSCHPPPMLPLEHVGLRCAACELIRLVILPPKLPVEHVVLR